ncbi:hypothetical protein ABK040_001593 [Willaertia magna]
MKRIIGTSIKKQGIVSKSLKTINGSENIYFMKKSIGLSQIKNISLNNNVLLLNNFHTFNVVMNNSGTTQDNNKQKQTESSSSLQPERELKVVSNGTEEGKAMNDTKSDNTQNTSNNPETSENQTPKKKKGIIKKFLKILLLTGTFTLTGLLILGSFHNSLDMTDIDDTFLTNFEHVQPEKQTFLQLLSRAIPTNFISRCWGSINSTEIQPAFLRPPVYELYGWLYGVDMNEVDKPLEEYKSLQEFFSRRLKPEARPPLSVQHKRKVLQKKQIDEKTELSERERQYLNSVLVSPVDGTVARFGTLSVELDHIDDCYEHVYLPQVKGVTYSMQQLLQKEKRNTSGLSEQQQKQKKQLHYCVLYLAPGDYHRFHSPCDFNVHSRKHIYGKLFPVMPLYLNGYPNLFTQNERVVLNGKWQYGNMHYVIVGALNVGSFVVHFDNSLKTNVKRPKVKKPTTPTTTETPKSDMTKSSSTDSAELLEKKTTEEHIKDKKKGEEIVVLSRDYVQGGLSLDKGEEIGYFKLGSTIILIFESDINDNLAFNIQKGQKVKLGDNIIIRKKDEKAVQ